MDVSKTRPSTNNTTLLLLLFGFPILSLFLTLSLIVTLFHKEKLIITQWPLLCVVLMVLTLALVVIATARATMVTWITVLVLLAFAGNRRRVLVKRGRTIASDVAMFLVGVLIRDQRSSLVALACATVLSLMAVIGFKEFQLISL